MFTTKMAAVNEEKNLRIFHWAVNKVSLIDLFQFFFISYSLFNLLQIILP